MKTTNQRAIAESTTGYIDDRRDRAPRIHRNQRIAELLAGHPHWTEPPGEDQALRFLFCEAAGELGVGSGFGTIADLALSGITARAPFDDGRSRQARAVGFMDRRSAAARERSTRRIVLALTLDDQRVLWLMYGPTRYSPENGNWPPQVHSRLGWRAGVMFGTSSALQMFAQHGDGTRNVVEWLMHEATREQIDEVDSEAEALCFGASNRWRDRRGRRGRGSVDDAELTRMALGGGHGSGR